MAATPARIAFITEQFRRVIATTAAAQTRYGTLARKSEDPIETFFDSTADAQIMATARQTLLSPSRRRFAPAVTGVQEALGLSFLGTAPLSRYVDPDRGADMPAIVGFVSIDFNRQSALFNVWG